MKEIYSLSAREIIRKIQTREISAKKVAEAFIARILEVNPKINALHQFNPARIINEAEKADTAVLEGKPLGRLHGLPITIKDTCLIAGFKVGKGYPPFFKDVKTDATAIRRLKEAGAIILGISNVPELLLAYEIDNRTNGRTNNPYDLSRTPGGSSGGEAAIIATGGSVVGIGSDAGGSIRQPTHYCGICAHKPTQGLVPFTGNIPSDGEAGLITSILTMGPMSRYIEDLSLIMEVISGSDNLDPHTPPVKFTSPNTVNINKLRIAYYSENPDAAPSVETIDAIKIVVDFLQLNVASIKHDFPKPLENIYRLHWETFVLAGDKGKGLKSLFEDSKDYETTPLLKKFLSQAEKCEFTLTEFRQRLVEVEQFRYELMRWMENYDVVISPVASTPARRHGETFDHIYDFNYVRTHNLSLWPATVVPVAFSKDGMPIGVQIAGKPWHDHMCLAIAHAIQKKCGVFPIPEIKERL